MLNKYSKQEILDKMSYYYKNFGLFRLTETTIHALPFYLFDKNNKHILLTHPSDLIKLKFNYRKINYEQLDKEKKIIETKTCNRLLVPSSLTYLEPYYNQKHTIECCYYQDKTMCGSHILKLETYSRTVDFVHSFFWIFQCDKQNRYNNIIKQYSTEETLDFLQALYNESILKRL